jgi:tetratricopeptide (TPR) repeat protein
MPGQSTVREAYEAIMRVTDVLISLMGTRYTDCPHEADVLAYSENRLSPRNRAQIERHFAKCHDCLEVLAFLGREAQETPAPLSEEAVSEQTDRVLAYIRNGGGPAKPVQVVPRQGFYISYPRLATVGLIITAVAFTSIFLFTRGQSPTEAALDAMKLAVKDKRHSVVRVSGGFDYSPFAETLRGDDESNDDLLFDRAESKARAATKDTSDANARLLMAQSQLVRGTPNKANQALLILEQLSKAGVETPEALNDLGVAHFQLLNYDEAVAYFTRALAKSPTFGEARFNRALAYERLNREEEAREDWRQFISQSSNDGWKSEAITRLNSLNRLSTPSVR